VRPNFFFFFFLFDTRNIYRCPRVAKKRHNLFVIKDINFFFFLDDSYASIAYTENIAVYRVSQKWRTNGALRCRRNYRKRQKNVKKILLDLFSDLAVFESGTQQVIILKYMNEIFMTATSNSTYYHKVQDRSLPISNPA
jgi:hypothetical protein